MVFFYPKVQLQARVYSKTQLLRPFHAHSGQYSVTDLSVRNMATFIHLKQKLKLLDVISPPVYISIKSFQFLKTQHTIENVHFHFYAFYSWGTNQGQKLIPKAVFS